MRLIEKTQMGELAKASKPSQKPASSVTQTSSKGGCTCGGTCPRCKSKLAGTKISAPGDKHEQDADQIAEKMLGTTTEKKNSVTTENVQSSSSVTYAGDNQIGLSGQPLSPELRARFESGSGADFSQVRLHTGIEAQALAAPLHAEAFTLGRNIVIGDPNFQASSPAGKNLLAHELAHTIQQGAAPHPAMSTTVAAPMIMRRLIRTAPISFLCGGSDPFIRSPNSGFMHLNSGETSISINTSIRWDRPGCSGDIFFTLKRHRSLIWDADEGERTMPVGTGGSATWSGLEENADYYFEIRSTNSNPNCCLTGSFDVNTP
ncbi:MAG: hypothetical protein B0W54_01690 [Cellvibrio sp. 79]|nr:MAG: hypothetical protein B0W54_01690 [Cellvibrio sp. 79]